MTPIEKQILKNQEIIMSSLSTLKVSNQNSNLLLREISNTNELLNPIKEQEPSCDMEEEKICDCVEPLILGADSDFCKRCLKKFAKGKKEVKE